jgi:hypothetical protein
MSPPPGGVVRAIRRAFLPVLGEGWLDLQDDGAITPPLGRDAARLRPRRGNIQGARGRRPTVSR